MYYILKKFKVTHGKNNFAEISKNLTKYKSKNNFVGPSK